MTRKDFELIARTLRVTRDSTLGQTRPEIEAAKVQWERTVGAFLGALTAQNPNFDQSKFLAACGVQS